MSKIVELTGKAIDAGIERVDEGVENLIGGMVSSTRKFVAGNEELSPFAEAFDAGLSVLEENAAEIGDATRDELRGSATVVFEDVDAGRNYEKYLSLTFEERIADENADNDAQRAKVRAERTRRKVFAKVAKATGLEIAKRLLPLLIAAL